MQGGIIGGHLPAPSASSQIRHRSCHPGEISASLYFNQYHHDSCVHLTKGNHVAFAASLLLEEYQVPKKYIKGIENAVKPKKQK